MKSRLRELYKKEIMPALMKKFSYKNLMQVPHLEKIVINSGVSEASQNIKALDVVVQEISIITGQKPVVTRAKKSISTFKIREGMPIGCKVTLRGDRMYEFFDRLVNAALPRTRDFKGIKQNAFDGTGNYSLGIPEYAIFPEIFRDKLEKARGIDVIFVTTAKSDEEAKALLKNLGMPFKE